MRISDHRYNRDRLRFDLAVRMLHHGARARTIRTWTGLSKDRQRKLFQVYLLQLPQPPERRMRSKLPHHASCFLRSSTLGFEATTLASLFSILGLICTEKAAEPQAESLAPKGPVPYNADSHFDLGQRITHKKFGEIVVVSVGETWIETELPDGSKKRLAHKPQA